MNIAGRDASKILRAFVQRQHYVAAATMMKDAQHPVRFLSNYVLGGGEYPQITVVRTPTGPVCLKLWCHDDLLTVNEIFFRGDYRSGPKDKVFVDFGSNIGISAAYFLSRSRDSFAYLFEPLPQNVVRLKENLAPFEGRYRVEQVAVGPSEGEFEFGWEETGRYGGLGRQTGKYMRVRCRDAKDIVDEVLARHGRIDVLKIDIETLEEEVVGRVAASAAQIRTVFVEYKFRGNPLAATHRSSQYGSVCQFFQARHA